MLQLKRYTIFALKASTSSIASHITTAHNKCVTHAVSFKGNRYIPTISDTQIVYNLLFQLRFLRTLSIITESISKYWVFG